MNTISSRIRSAAIMLLLILVSIPSFGQNYTKAEWRRIKMDQTFDGLQGKTTKVIDEHKATSPMLLKPVGKCSKVLQSRQLSDLVTDIMLDYAAQRLSRATKNPQAKADIAIVKFRSPKSCIPAGDVTPFDIISLFPMDNQTVILDLKGIHVKKLIHNSIKNGAVSSLDEASVKDERIYKVITIDCMLKGKAGSDIMECAEKLDNCNTPLGNMLVLHIKNLHKEGKQL